MKLFLMVFGIFAFCILAMAVGVIIRNRGFTSCGRAAAEAEGGTCSVCGVTSEGRCHKEKKKSEPV